MVRIMIVLLLAGSAYLGWNAWQQHQRLDYLRSALAEGGDVPRLVRQIQENSELYAAMAERRRGEGVRGDDPTQYVYRIAGMTNVGIGRVDVTPGRREKPVGNNAVDRTYTIEPSDRKALFSRGSIANFLFKLEDDSKRIKVTSVELNAAGNPKPHEVPEDRWSMTVAITMREKKKTR